MDKYKQYLCTNRNKNGKCEFTGKETAEEIEKKILSENDLLEFHHETYSTGDAYKNVKTAEDFLNSINGVTLFETAIKTKFGTNIRTFSTRFVASKKIQHPGARYGRSLADVFLVGKALLPEMTLRELMTAYLKLGTYTICRDIRKRLMNTVTSKSHVRYCTDVLTLDEFNKTIPDWCNELGVEYTLSADVVESDKLVISDDYSSRGFMAATGENAKIGTEQYIIIK
jgi:hypothetical protein